tara:strand:- start:334 stop:564 length:231 start_codon:yes stop_codon:yes gene_type:complete
MGWKGRILGYDENGTPIEITSDLLIRYSIGAYLAIALFGDDNHYYIMNYNLFFLTGMVGLSIAIYLGIMDVVKEEK